jgi:hypothetical protein
MKPTTNPALESDTLYAKSQVYIQRGFRAQAAGDTEEYQLWASLALELLGKAALAEVHPALVADPMHAASLFAACGCQISPDIKTIAAHTLFERLCHISKDFDSRHKRFCEQMSLRRNSELHSGESPFSGMVAEAWEREFWGAVEAILQIHDQSLDGWLGSASAKAPAKIIEQAREATQWAVQNRISRCEQDFKMKYQDPKRRQTVIEESKNLGWHDHTWNGRDRARCPACLSSGYLGGTLRSEEYAEVESSYPEVDEDGDLTGEIPMARVEKTFGVDDFFCPVCGLRLFGRKEIAAAELPTEFVHTEEHEQEYEPEYGND